MPRNKGTWNEKCWGGWDSRPLLPMNRDSEIPHGIILGGHLLSSDQLWMVNTSRLCDSWIEDGRVVGVLLLCMLEVLAGTFGTDHLGQLEQGLGVWKLPWFPLHGCVSFRIVFARP